MLDDIRGRAQSWGVKIIFGIIIVVFIFWGVGNMSRGSAHSVASVNGRNISLKEFSEEVSRQFEAARDQQPDLATNPDLREAFKKEVLQLLVRRSVIQQEAERLGIAVSPPELLRYIEKSGWFQDSAGKFSKEKYLERLKAMGHAPGDFEEAARNEILEGKLQAYIASSVNVTETEAKSSFDFRMEKIQAEYLLFPVADYMAGAAPAEAEVTGYYEANKARFAQPDRISLEYVALTPKELAAAYPPSPEEVRAYFEKNRETFAEQARYDVRHIFVLCPPDGSTEDGAADLIVKARAKVDDIMAQLKKGADFSELAKKDSEDPRSAPDGGALGWLLKASLPAPADAAITSLKKGEFSEPVRTEFGFHIFRLDDKTDEKPAQFDTLEAQIRERLGAEKAGADFDRIQAAAEKGLYEKSLAELAKEFKVNLSSTGVIAEADVPQLLALRPGAMEFLKNVPTGQVAPTPLEITDGIALVMVKERLAAAPSPFDAVRADIARELTEKKAHTLAREAAEKALPDILSGKAQPDKTKLKMTEPVMRVFPAVPPLGEAPALATALGSAQVNVWLPSAYDTPAGGVIARVVSITPSTDELWTTQKESFMMRRLQMEQSEAVTAFLNSLFASAKVEVNAEALKQINWR